MVRRVCLRARSPSRPSLPRHPRLRLLLPPLTMNLTASVSRWKTSERKRERRRKNDRGRGDKKREEMAKKREAWRIEKDGEREIFSVYFHPYDSAPLLKMPSISPVSFSLFLSLTHTHARTVPSLILQVHKPTHTLFLSLLLPRLFFHPLSLFSPLFQASNGSSTSSISHNLQSLNGGRARREESGVFPLPPPSFFASIAPHVSAYKCFWYRPYCRSVGGSTSRLRRCRSRRWRSRSSCFLLHKQKRKKIEKGIPLSLSLLLRLLLTRFTFCSNHSLSTHISVTHTHTHTHSSPSLCHTHTLTLLLKSIAFLFI